MYNLKKNILALSFLISTYFLFLNGTIFIKISFKPNKLHLSPVVMLPCTQMQAERRVQWVEKFLCNLEIKFGDFVKLNGLL